MRSIKDAKYMRIIQLRAQIAVLEELPYETVYQPGTDPMKPVQKSAVMMTDLCSILNSKREELAELDDSKTIARLKADLKKIKDEHEKNKE